MMGRCYSCLGESQSIRNSKWVSRVIRREMFLSRSNVSFFRIPSRQCRGALYRPQGTCHPWSLESLLGSVSRCRSRYLGTGNDRRVFDVVAASGGSSSCSSCSSLSELYHFLPVYLHDPCGNGNLVLLLFAGIGGCAA